MYCADFVTARLKASTVYQFTEWQQDHQALLKGYLSSLQPY